MIAKTKLEEVKSSYESLWDISEKNIDSKQIRLGDIATEKKLKCVIVVNVASRWGLTDEHYKELVKIHNKYKDQGFDIFAFPSNQFMKQESGTDE